jgi:hypothetical protein
VRRNGVDNVRIPDERRKGSDLLSGQQRNDNISVDKISLKNKQEVIG